MAPGKMQRPKCRAVTECGAVCGSSGSRMDAQILDVDCVQVGRGEHDASWLASLRTNAVLYSATPDAKEIGKYARARGYAYVVRLWCRTTSSDSICVLVADPWSTSYRKLKPVGGLENLARAMQEELNAKAQNVGGMADVCIVFKKSTNGYEADPETLQPRRHPWLRVRVVSAYLRGQQSTAMCRAQERSFVNAQCTPATDAESRVDVHSELLQSLGLRPGGWLHIPSSAWARAQRGGGRTATALHVQVSRDEIELARDPRHKISAIRVLSWDIECYSKRHAFPMATNPDDAIIAIGMCSRTMYGDAAQAPFEERVVLCLHSVAPAKPGLVITTFDSEIALLQAFADYIQKSDADVLVGYNTCGFDWRYIKERLLLHEERSGDLTRSEHEAITRLSRATRQVCALEEHKVGSAAMGDNPLCYPRTPGRVGIDLWFYLKRENAPELPNLKLDTVAAHYLGEAKINLSAKAMFEEYERGPEGRLAVAEYCCQDCVLVLRLLEKLHVLPTLLEMAKVTHTIPEDLLYRGQQIKVYMQLLAAAHEFGDYVVEDAKQQGEAAGEEEGAPHAYQGAHVEEPQVGYYLDPILTVDFASLYPSLMRTYNLSPDSLIPPGAEPIAIPHTSIAVVPGREPLRFVAASHCRGLLPRILDRLVSERQRVKHDMAQEGDEFQRQLLNAKQLALKMSANAVYGACGAARGLLQCRDVAEATTSVGRDIILFTKQIIEKDFKVQGCKVIYGDSVAGDTPLVVRRRGVPGLCRIDELHADLAGWWHGATGKEEAYPEALEVYSDGGFTPVSRILRHLHAGPLVRVSTAVGCVDCTLDHSLLLVDGTPVTPSQLPSRARLMHSDDADILAAFAKQPPASMQEGEAFALGCFFASGSCSATPPVSGSAATWRLACDDSGAHWARAARGLLFPTERLASRSGVFLVPAMGHVEAAAAAFGPLFYDAGSQMRVPPDVLALPPQGCQEFWKRCMQGRSSLRVRGKTAAAGLWIVGRRLGHSLRLRSSPGGTAEWHEVRTHVGGARPSYRPLVPLDHCAATGARYVYDLETTSHHFHVAPGDLVVQGARKSKIENTSEGYPRCSSLPGRALL